MARRGKMRWRYVVDWNLQGSLVLYGIAYGTLVLLAISAGVFVPLLRALDPSSEGPIPAELSIVMLYLHEHLWWLLGACMVLVVLGAVLFSHRIAGPMVRFKRNLRLLGDGKLPAELRTRRNDFLKEEVVCLNEAVAGIAERVDAIRHAQLLVRRRVTNCVSTTLEQSEELEGLVAACEELEQAVRQFQYVDPGDDLAVVADDEAAPAAPALTGCDG